ncbi:GIY-YIG nuclease family protein [Agromyces aerolatus]|uniref:GIY-YIG nuclease family protein n=1 Tax=Agromyces sp. LY-1074 TaxID=3074080 RepID=UPI00285A1D4C|nr:MULTISPECIES: GIY-YIG nuclease family protein [unclassified Agromyces]MDR5701378.1 GIY-YIG nuclease family protein [Agromyces sp. LY-1074]MDR5706833.1 GIY-YIG nuclease family protein [Agromyces sp. LY-1358]
MALCAAHLAAAHEWVEREVGVADLLPAPCTACGHAVGARYPSGWICARCEWRFGDVPDAELIALGELRVDVVYYVRWRDQVKIGTTANPKRRLAALPVEEVLAFERGDRLVERRRHEQFAAHRFPRTEWFRLHDELLALTDELSAGVDDPWVLVDRWTSRRLAARA